MKAYVRQINKQASTHTIAMFLVANVILGVLWFTELYIPQSDTSRLNVKTIQDNIAEINNYKAKVCLDTTVITDDSIFRKTFESYLAVSAFEKCTRACDACVTFSLETNVSPYTG